MENCCRGSGSTMTTQAMKPMKVNDCCGPEARVETNPETSARSESPCRGPAVGSDVLPAAEATTQKTSCC